MSVVVSVEDVGPCKKQLTVEVPAPAVEAETQRVVAEYGQKVRIPGFRRGKVPAELLRRRFQKDIDQEVVDRLLPRYWRQAEAESAIDPLLPPEVDRVDEPVAGKPFTFVATVETRPAIELRNYRDFDLPNPPVEPGTMEVDDSLEELRKQFSDWVPVERPASRADLVTGEIVESLPSADSAQDQEGEPRTIEVEVGDPRVWEELSLALSGLSAGQETTFTRHEEEEAHGDHVHAAHDRHFRVRVTAVKERELPDLDDEFASRVDPRFETLEPLRLAIVERLRREKQGQRDEQRQTALLDQLRERHPMEMPRGVVQKEVERLVNDYAEALSRRGVDVEHAGIDWNEMGGQMLPLAEKRVQARLLLDAIAEAESVRLSEEEFEGALTVLARAQKTSTLALRRALDEDGRLANLRSQLRRDKTLRHLLGESGGETSASEPGTEG